MFYPPRISQNFWFFGYQLTKIECTKTLPNQQELVGVAARLGTSPEPPSWPFSDVDVEGLLGGSDFLPYIHPIYTPGRLRAGTWKWGDWEDDVPNFQGVKFSGSMLIFRGVWPRTCKGRTISWGRARDPESGLMYTPLKTNEYPLKRDHFKRKPDRPPATYFCRGYSFVFRGEYILGPAKNTGKPVDSAG